jgi:hypothetical protein
MLEGHMIKRLFVLLLCAGFGVALGALASAQGRQPDAKIVSGDDIGFKLDSVQRTRKRLTGTLMVRLNGAWVEADFVSKPVPATH